MPLKDREARRAYQRKWIAPRRKEWFDKNGPCVDCGSWNALEADHVDPLQKRSHRIWSYCKEKREYELAKCVARCSRCHKDKSRKEGSFGRNTPYQRFVPSNVTEAYELTQENECLTQVLPQAAESVLQVS